MACSALPPTLAHNGGYLDIVACYLHSFTLLQLDSRTLIQILHYQYWTCIHLRNVAPRSQLLNRPRGKTLSLADKFDQQAKSIGDRSTVTTSPKKTSIVEFIVQEILASSFVGFKSSLYPCG
jgi:hypothetical protein